MTFTIFTEFGFDGSWIHYSSTQRGIIAETKEEAKQIAANNLKEEYKSECKTVDIYGQRARKTK